MAPIEPMMEEDQKTYLGPTIDEEKVDVQTITKVVVFADTCHQEVLECDRIVLREVGRLEE